MSTLAEPMDLTFVTTVQNAVRKQSSEDFSQKQALRMHAVVRHFYMVGIVASLTLSVIPIRSALTLLADQNYAFWLGQSLPIVLVYSCGVFIFAYMATVACLLRHGGSEISRKWGASMLVGIFFAVIGLFLILVSVMMTDQANNTSDNLLMHCSYSQQTRGVYEYSQMLQSIRAQPDCVNQSSVEECHGYSAVHPHAGYLKMMESEFQCTGLCYRAMFTMPDQPAPPTLVQTGAQAGAKAGNFVRRKRHHVRQTYTPTSLVALATTLSTDVSNVRVRLHPKALFTRTAYDVTCEAEASRQIKDLVENVSTQTFSQGVCLVVMAIATGFLNVVYFCITGDNLANYTRESSYKV